MSENERAQLRKKWNIDDGTFIVGHVCRPQPQKGIELFIQSIYQANKGMGGQRIQGVLVGGAGAGNQERMSSYEKEMQDLSRAKNRSVLFLGSTREPLQWMQAMDVIVNTAISPEGFGLTLIEGMAVGRVPIGPDEGGPQEIINHGETGFLFQPRDCRDLVKYLVRLASHPELLTQMGQNAYAVVRERFDIQRVISELENQYRALYGEN